MKKSLSLFFICKQTGRETTQVAILGWLWIDHICQLTRYLDRDKMSNLRQE